MKPSQRLKFAQLARPGRPSALAPLWVQGLSQEVHPAVVVGVSVGEGVFAAGLSGAGGPVGQFRRAEGRLGWVFDVPRVHAASGDPHVAEGGPGDDPAAVPEAFPAGGDGLFPTPGQPRLREASGEAVPDVVDGRGGPAPGHLCPGGSGRPREPVSVASAVGRETVRHGAVRRRLAGRLRFRADPSMAPGGAGYREHHPGHGVLSRTGPDPLPASSAPLLPPPEIRSAVDRRDGRFGPPAEIWGGPDDPPEAGSPAGFGLQPSAGRCGSLGSSALPRGSTVVRNAYGIPTPMRFSTEQRVITHALLLNCRTAVKGPCRLRNP
jgi:hypothetical protein